MTLHTKQSINPHTASRLPFGGALAARRSGAAQPGPSSALSNTGGMTGPESAAPERDAQVPPTPDPVSGPLPDHPFDGAITARPRGTDLFQAEILPSWNVMRGPNGGYLAALLLHTMARRLADQSRQPRTFTAHYVSVPTAGAAEIRTRLERSGRSLSWIAAELWQGESLRVAARATFTAPAPGIQYESVELPSVPQPDSVESLEPTMMPPFAAHYDYRSLYATPYVPLTAPRVGGWIRLRQPRQADAPLIAALSDAWFPATYGRSAEHPVGATLDLTVHFRNHAALERLAPDDFVLSVFTSSTASEGFFEEDGTLWSADGALLAQSRQLAIARPMGG